MLCDAGFRRLEPDISTKSMGILGTAGYIFASLRDTQRWPTMLHLLPQSLVHLTISDTEPIPSCLDQTRTVHRPRLPEHCVSLIKCLEDYPFHALNRSRAERYLLLLFLLGAYKETYLDKLWVPEEELESEAEFQVRRAAAVKEIESWELSKEHEPYRQKLVKALLSDDL